MSKPKPGSAKDARARQWVRRGFFDVVVADPSEAQDALADAKARLLLASNSYTANKDAKTAVIAEAEKAVADAEAALAACTVRLWFQKVPRTRLEELRRKHPRPTVERDDEGNLVPLTDEQAASYHFVEALACAMAHEAGDKSMSEAEWVEWLNSDAWDPEDFTALSAVLSEIQTHGSSVAMLGKGGGPKRTTG